MATIRRAVWHIVLHVYLNCVQIGAGLYAFMELEAAACAKELRVFLLVQAALSALLLLALQLPTAFVLASQGDDYAAA